MTVQKYYVYPKSRIRAMMNLRLVAFLKKHRCLNRFINNTYGKLNSHYSSDVAILAMDHSLKLAEYDIIISRFSWKDSPEGHAYWSNIDDLWKRTM